VTDLQTKVVELVEAATDDQRPLIQLVAGRLPEIATEAEAAIVEAGLAIFRRGATLVRPVVEELDAARSRKTKVAQLAIVDAASLRDYLGQAARWERYVRRERQWIAADPPKDIAATILSRFGRWTFAPVVGVLTTPTLRMDGSLLDKPGYDPATRLILTDPPAMPRLPAKPLRTDAEAALALLDGLLDEFPFTDDAARSVGLSAIITPIVRGAFPVTPMHAARAPVSASGKSYLFDVAAAVAIGQPCPVMAAGRTEEETEKRLGAALLAGQPLIAIDNVTGELGGAALCQAIERPVVEIRILGRSEHVRIEARGTTIFATGNNLTLVGDMTRRAIVATLDPILEQPELRQFTGDPVANVLADRGRYVTAALTICRAYIVAGRPDPARRLASFEGWSDTVRSALMWLGRADPVETMETARAEDPQLAMLREFLAAWSDTIGTSMGTRRTAGDVLKMVNETCRVSTGEYHDQGEREYRHPELRDAVLAVASIRGRLEGRTFGRWLARHKGRIVAGLRLAGEGDAHGHPIQWWVEHV
jgi:putative DNA primase/helicase